LGYLDGDGFVDEYAHYEWILFSKCPSGTIKPTQSAQSLDHLYNPRCSEPFRYSPGSPSNVKLTQPLITFLTGLDGGETVKELEKDARSRALEAECWFKLGDEHTVPDFDEVEFWKKRITQLCLPVKTCDAPSPLGFPVEPVGGNYHMENANTSKGGHDPFHNWGPLRLRLLGRGMAKVVGLTTASLLLAHVAATNLESLAHYGQSISGGTAAMLGFALIGFQADPAVSPGLRWS